jgi:DNA-binding NtrC family response regulator
MRGPREISRRTATIAARHVLPPLGVVLRVVRGASARSAEYRLSEGRCIVGGGRQADFSISDPAISREHVELTLVPEGVAVRDLGSRNGTFYLGQRIDRIIVAPGVRLTLGSTELAIDPDTEALEGPGPHEGDSFRGMVARSESMRRLFAMLARLEGSLVTVLVSGESGVGKELVARAIHEGSAVATGPLVIVNCGALARELIASELFGHRKGAFTGAMDARRGAFVSADGGTLFLDEIGELPLELQPALLRALEAGEVRPVGDDRPVQVRVRVVAATNRDLREEVHAGRFREDLYYRLAVIELHVPPLRDRPEDIEPLARLFASAAGLKELPAPMLERLKAQAWPGNARQLRNAVETFAALGMLPSPGSAKAPSAELALAQFVDVHRPFLEQRDELSDRFTRLYLRALLMHTGGNQAEAARAAGIDRTYIARLLSKYGLSKT